MISYIRGPLAEINEDMIVVEAGAVGYNIRVPLSVVEGLPGIGKEVKIYTYLQVREDAMSLYGFLTRQDLKMFRLLLGVSGIGPKGALGLLSAMRPDDLRLAVISGDVKAISRAPGIGNKTAQRLILDLKDKIPVDQLLSAPRVEPGREPADTGLGEAAREAVEALIALGYSPGEAARAVSKTTVTENMTGEDVLKASLRHLAF
ncbi:MAG: Holliday junction branch migration protein RuvA [Hungatella sp.]|nr:Holliday junction branch migration protein RuvA [Hungatella sp.]MCI9501771.1 Holliday junction branch migration protein RuvA [Hungatella sp.]MCI9635546.1 Holliday junction branch migration protein RuvA [Hungatella sp.]